VHDSGGEHVRRDFDRIRSDELQDLYRAKREGSANVTTEVRPWFTTASGKQMFVHDPDPANIDIHDIANALSKICRFNGHCQEFYSVAQHSCIVAAVAAGRGMSRRRCLFALLHDAAEAYVQDIISPLKRSIGGRYEAIEAKWEGAIWQAFNLSDVACDRLVRQAIKSIDLRVLATEHRDIVPDGRPWEMLNGIEPYDFTIKPIADWRQARAAFMEHYLSFQASIPGAWR
jgi:hypothetical protein